MEFRDVVLGRRMTRAYQPDRPVPAEVVTGLLGLAVRAPSAGNTQGWSFLTLREPQSVQRFWELTTDGGEPDSWLRGMRTAPCLILCFSDKTAYIDRYAEPDKGWTDRDEARWPVPYWDIDTGMAAMILMLAAEDRGLASCFFGVPRTYWDALRREFGVAERLTPIGVVSLGEPAPDVRSPSLRRGRRPLEDVVAAERYS